MNTTPRNATYHRRIADLHELIAQSVEGTQRWNLAERQEHPVHPVLYYTTEAAMHQFDGEINAARITMVVLKAKLWEDSDSTQWCGHLFIGRDIADLKDVIRIVEYDTATLTIYEPDLDDMRLEGFDPHYVRKEKEHTRREQAMQRW